MDSPGSRHVTTCQPVKSRRETNGLQFPYVHRVTCRVPVNRDFGRDSMRILPKCISVALVVATLSWLHHSCLRAAGTAQA